jgi:hypothetical protein
MEISSNSTNRDYNNLSDQQSHSDWAYPVVPILVQTNITSETERARQTRRETELDN